MHLFYVPDIEIRHILPEEESKHAVKVLRLQPGDDVILVDGVGGWYRGAITQAHPLHCEFEIKETIPNYGKRNYHLHIGIAPTKNIDRFEWFLEKATEIGIDEITPIICHNSERRICKPERWEKILIAASKQSLKAFFPRLNPAISFDNFIKKTSTKQKMIAHCYESIKLSLKFSVVPSSDSIILIGPEGDFSKEEILKAIDNQYRPVSLGKSRLRTETAGVVACHTIALMNDE
ncbi:MAG: 16S rRNA (uracil(1498)-N(3))-methyltransferase [Paludibacteraceae bacterium]